VVASLCGCAQLRGVGVAGGAVAGPAVGAGGADATVPCGTPFSLPSFGATYCCWAELLSPLLDVLGTLSLSLGCGGGCVEVIGGGVFLGGGVGGGGVGVGGGVGTTILVFLVTETFSTSFSAEL
jgi:hypothetical protein